MAAEAPFDDPPEPAGARTPQDLVVRLRLLRVWAGSPSYAHIARRVNQAWRAAGRPEREWTTARATVADCFTVRPRGTGDDLLLAVVAVLNPDAGYLARWRQVARIVRGEAEAASLVSAQDRLPGGFDGFTGREAELARLAGLLDAPAAVVSVEGMPGIGKTALAVRAAQRLVEAGHVVRVLAADLRGFHPDPGQPPAAPAAVLAEFLRLLGIPGDQIPQHHDPRVALNRRIRQYRDLVRDMRLLVLLDNAGGTGQVRHLIPTGPACRTLITSRRALAGLGAARRMVLGALTPDEAGDLLRAACGAERFAAGQHAAARIARLLGYLPLALNTLATRISVTDWPLADHLERLLNRLPRRGTPRQPQDRVDLALTIRLEDPVRRAIDPSYDDLAPRQQQLLRLLALHPGPDIDTDAAAALAALTPPACAAALDRLLAANLLQQHAPGRYTLHDVVRAYAAHRAHLEDAGTTRRAAQQRLFDHYRHTASRPVNLAWLDTERPNLEAVAAHAADHGWPAHASDLSKALRAQPRPADQHEPARDLTRRARK